MLAASLGCPQNDAVREACGIFLALVRFRSHIGNLEHWTRGSWFTCRRKTTAEKHVRLAVAGVLGVLACRNASVAIPQHGRKPHALLMGRSSPDQR